jgi:hypothetical protein
VHYNANERHVALLGEGLPIPQQDNYRSHLHDSNQLGRLSGPRDHARAPSVSIRPSQPVRGHARRGLLSRDGALLGKQESASGGNQRRSVNAA